MQPARVVEEPRQILGCLAQPARLGGHLLDLVRGQLVVEQRDRHQQRIGSGLFLDGVGDVAQQTQPRRAQLARPRASALDRPDHVRPVRDHLAHEAAQRELVDGHIAGGAPDVHHAGAPREGAEREEVEVRAGEPEGRMHPEFGERAGERPFVEVRAVRDEEDQRVFPVEGAQVRDGLLVDEAVVTPQHPLTELAPVVEHGVAVRRRHLQQVLADLGDHIGDRNSDVAGEFGCLRNKVVAAEHCLDDRWIPGARRESADAAEHTVRERHRVAATEVGHCSRVST